MIRSLVCFLLITPALFGADSLNIAPYSKPFIKHVGSIPPSPDPLVPDVSKIQPSSLNDRSYLTFVEFPVSPVSNIHSSFGIELPDSFVIRSVRSVNLFNSLSSYRLRIRGCQLFGAGSDTAQWTLIAELPNNSDTTRTYLDLVVADSTRKWKNLKLVLTKQDASISTVSSEFQVFISLTSVKAITNVAFPAPTIVDGESFQTIQWQSVNLLAGEKVNLFYAADGSENFLPLSMNESNDGTFDWKTTRLPDGKYRIKVDPSVTGEKLALTVPVTVQNYSNGVLTLTGQSNQFSDFFGNYYHSAFTDDSVKLSWSYSSLLKKDRSHTIRYSPDSGKQWIPIITSLDSSRRSYVWKVPQDHVTSLYAFFEAAVVTDTIEVARFRTPIPRILVGGWSFADVQWSKRSHSAGNPSGAVGVFRSSSDNKNRIVLGPRWMVRPNGDTLPVAAWNTNRSVGKMAVSDLEGNGSLEVISSAMISESGTDLYIDTLGKYGSDPVIADLNGDGKKEIVFHRSNMFTAVAYDWTSLLSVTVPPTLPAAYSVSTAVDLNADGQKEIVYAVMSYNTIHAFDKQGIGVAGFPVVVGGVIQNSPLAADLYKNGEPVIIVTTTAKVYCFDKSGKLIDGFPYSQIGQIDKNAPAVADMDNDGFLDILFTSSGNTIHCVNRFGSAIPGWPVTVNSAIPHYRYNNSFIPPTIVPSILNGTLSSPYIVSIDGDSYNEVVLFSSNGQMHVYDHTGKPKNGFPVFVGAYQNVSAYFGDVDDNGTLNAIIPVMYTSVVMMLNLDFGPGSYNAARVPWPMERQNMERTGIAPYPIPVSVRSEPTGVPARTMLMQNYPNPFNPQTTITFSLSATGSATLKIYDVLGREVRTVANGRMDAGVHTYNFNAADLPSGLYFYTLRSGAFTQTKNMLLVK